MYVSGKVDETGHKNGSEIYKTADRQTDKYYFNDLAATGSRLTFPTSLLGSLLFL